MSKYGLNTGDILLFSSKGRGIFRPFDFLIKYFTHSPYTHIGMILKDPEFIHPSLKGYYVWESSWNGTPDPQDGKIKLGVQITPFNELIEHSKENNGKVFYRKFLNNDDSFTNEKLTTIHNTVYCKPYDLVPKDWIDMATHHENSMDGKNTKRFWCSALVGYIYTKCGILSESTEWSCLSPADFSSNSEDIAFIDNQRFVTNDIEI